MPHEASTRTLGDASAAVERILALVAEVTGVDFAQYKRGAIQRRLARRMALRGAADPAAYLRSLIESEDDAEVEQLCEDLLVGATSFFRDPRAYEALARVTFPELCRERGPRDTVRAWVLGCSTGEEAYSLAIAFTEYAESTGQRIGLQVFATDVNARSIERARSGHFTRAIARHVSPRRLQRFFVEVEGGYRIAKPIRDLCVFARQNGLTDPPFSRLDLLVCRNVLSYLQPALQQRVLPVLHYALRSSGFLWLGRTETAGQDLFELRDRAHRIYARKALALGEPAARRHAAILLPLPPNATGSALDVARLEKELRETRESLEAVIEEQEATNRDLQAGNEEVHSGNEELQSINEELETSKEELQAANEALTQLNEDSQDRNRALARSNDDLTNLLASVQMAIVMLGPDLAIRRFTPTAAKLFHLVAADVGRPITDMAGELVVDDLRQLVMEAIASERTCEREVQDLQGRWHLLRVQPYRTHEATIDGAVLVLIDTDALKRNESVLRESEARFAVIADSAPLPIWVNDLEGCLFVNRAFEEFTGVPQSGLRGQRWTRLVHTGDRAPFMSAYLDALERRVPFEHKFRFRRHDGEFRWMMTVGKPRFLPSGEFLGYVGCTYDVTEMQQAEAAWQELDQRKNEFLATLAHELRNPLAAVRNASHLLVNGRDDGRIAARACEVIERQTANMVRLVDDLLDASRLSHGKVQLQLAPVELAGILQQVIAATEPERSAAHQHFAAELVDGPVTVQGDATRLDQVFTNVLNNASKYTPSGGHIALALEIEDSHERAAAVVRVRDDGIGIDSASIGKIFELFVQGESHENAHGMGLGLALARQLVESHGGSIEARSEGPGLGSEFIVRLPLVHCSVAPSATAPEPERREKTTRHTILLVDDDVDAGETLAELLRSQAYPVFIARAGREALRMAQDVRPDVVLLDIGLPDMTGHEVARRLRHAAPTTRATIIAITGYGQEGDLAKSRQAGCDRHMVKPIDLHGLLDTIESAPRHPEARTAPQEIRSSGEVSR